MTRILAIWMAMVLLAGMTAFAMAEEADATEAPDAQEAAFEVIRVDSRGDQVAALQRKLNALGYSAGAADGIFGLKTQNALKAFQADAGWEETGVVADQEMLDSILSFVRGDGINLIWDGRFQDLWTRWTKWGRPALCERVALDGRSWLHLITTGRKEEGVRQDVTLRGGDIARAELVAGETYILSFTAFGDEASAGRAFGCLVQNRDNAAKMTQETYMTPEFQLSTEPETYSVVFVPTVDGSFNVAIGTYMGEGIEAWFTDVKLEKGNKPTEWSESPELS